MRTLVLSMLVLFVLLALVPAAVADTPTAAPESAATLRAYAPAHWSGLVRKLNSNGVSIGWKWSGGMMRCSSYATGRLCLATNISGTSQGYYVQIGAGYGRVR